MVAFPNIFNLQYDMFEKIHKFVTQSTLTSGIYNTVYTFIQTKFDKLKETLSDNTFNGIIDIVDKVVSISLILLVIYVIYSTLVFIYSLIFKGKLKVKILISLILAIPFLIVVYVIYAYINIS